MFNKGDLIIEKADELGGETMGVITKVTLDSIWIHWLTNLSGKTGGEWACPLEIAIEAVKCGEWVLQSTTRNN